MTAPLWASLLSLVVAVIPPLQHAIEVHLGPIKDATSQVGSCSIPLTLVVLGAYFYKPPQVDAQNGTPRAKTKLWSMASNGSLVSSVRGLLGGQSEDETNTDRDGVNQATRQSETKTVIVSIAARMLIAPAILLPLLALGAWLDVPDVFEECVHHSHTMECALY